MLQLQTRIREILTATPEFADKVRVLIEDKEGIYYLVSRYTGALNAPLAAIQTTAGTALPPNPNLVVTREELTVSIISTPATDKSGIQPMDLVLAVITCVNGALVDPTHTAHGAPHFTYSGHTDASERPGEVIHNITFNTTLSLARTPTQPAPAGIE